MALLLSLAIFFSLDAIGVMIIVKLIRQRDYDHNRVVYRLTFPSDLEAERVGEWLEVLSGTLNTGFKRIVGVYSLTFETWATSSDVFYRLIVPWEYQQLVKNQLTSHAPGLQVRVEERPPPHDWTRAVEVGLTNTTRTLRVNNPTSLSTELITALKGSLEEGEMAMMQWVVTPAVPQHKPQHNVSKTNELNLFTLLHGNRASRDEIDDRRQKLDEPNMQAILRIAAKAGTKSKADNRIHQVRTVLVSKRGPATVFREQLADQKRLKQRIAGARTPLFFPAQLSISELSALIAWPLGNPLIQGLPMALSRQMPATTSVLRSGRLLGMSTFAGQERPIAIGYREALMHMQVVGSTGVGKTEFLNNMSRQDMEAGYGVVIIESKGDLFRKALDSVPKWRFNDTIVLDVNDTRSPVGFNILRQGFDPAIGVDEITRIFNNLFPERQSVYLQDLMYHGLHTLETDPDATFIDLLALFNPDDTERDWRESLIRNLRDPSLKKFWYGFDKLSPSLREQKVAPLKNRVWMMSRSKLMNIVGQSSSSFFMDDVIRGNKILLVNLSGIEREASSLMGTILLNAIWNSAKAVRSETPTYVYMDEAQHYANLPIDISEPLVQGRAFNIGFILAHQFNDQFPPGLKEAVNNSARSKVVFQTGDNDARGLAKTLGSNLTPQDIMNLPAYEAFARLMTPKGMAPPLSMTTLPPAPPTGLGAQVVLQSRQTYGREAQQVSNAMLARRQTSRPSSQVRRPRISGADWGN